ncbi:glycosyltransferase family 2 protein [Agrilactobacillus fermenti]|uniref:glycosyltransferase family 2 protein n=1 Tax=Agrilactobacillus fermenti TaxID=2586909 RepID=UPI001E35450C|nr:glycosyltransferase family 2 protein [Agrilactobacillus fermenti]MCD2256940.1 glycosyltransferase family 2 protein [Agrilactobacillus fermenti]
MQEDKLIIVMPAYNEAENIAEVVKEWHQLLQQVSPTGKLLVVNDGSKDQTLTILEQLKTAYAQLEVVDKPNSGHGATILLGYQRALRQEPDYIFQTDSDGQTTPLDFKQFWVHRQDYDAQFGLRTKREDGISRLVVTRVLKLVVGGAFHVWLPDANVPYRLMTASSLAEVLEKIPANYFLANVLMTVLYKKQHRRMRFLPITFRPRQGGQNSINLPKIIKIGQDSVLDFLRVEHKLNNKK